VTAGTGNLTSIGHGGVKDRFRLFLIAFSRIVTSVWRAEGAMVADQDDRCGT
jgi:hypothetical protein